MLKVREDQVEVHASMARDVSPTVAREQEFPATQLEDRYGADLSHGLPNSVAHARSLNHLTNDSPARAPGTLLRMQSIYGNRYVQRVLDIAKKSDGEGEVTPDVEASIERSRGGGQALDKTAQGQMESAFGVDFGSVRVHTGAESHALNRAVNAVVFTTGSDIFFRDGAYDPGSAGGKQLLAHELTHVVQQGAAAPSSGGKANRFEIDRACAHCEEEDKNKHMQTKLVVGPADDPQEREAEAVASAVTADIANSSTVQAPVSP